MSALLCFPGYAVLSIAWKAAPRAGKARRYASCCLLQYATYEPPIFVRCLPPLAAGLLVIARLHGRRCWRFPAR